MRRKSSILASLSVAILGSTLLIDAYAQERPACYPEFITVPQGTCRAALEQSKGDGTWTFTIDRVNGKISRVDIQIYESALPTSGMIADVYAVCASIPDPYDRVQETCGLELPEGRVANAGSVSIKRVTSGAKASITLDEGVYCVRPCVFGNGEVTISIQPPY